VSVTQEKIQELDQTVKDHKKMLRKHEWNMQDTWDIIQRPNLHIMDTEEEIQTKGTDTYSKK
jgi:hypothetical protein